jgi:hypothetical protein
MVIFFYREADLWWCGCRIAGYMDLPTKGGFDFGLCRRNQSLAEKKGLKIPGFLKTGTTIVGLVFKVWLISSLLLSRVQ